jgi:Protein of unknown function (DUF2281)
MKTLEELMHELTPELRQEVQDFVRSLVGKRTPPKHKKLKLNWAGALAEFRDRYSSLDLQKKALEWWGD